jgi:hypothetical protein
VACGLVDLRAVEGDQGVAQPPLGELQQEAHGARGRRHAA